MLTLSHAQVVLEVDAHEMLETPLSVKVSRTCLQSPRQKAGTSSPGSKGSYEATTGTAMTIDCLTSRCRLLSISRSSSSSFFPEGLQVPRRRARSQVCADA